MDVVAIPACGAGTNLFLDLKAKKFEARCNQIVNASSQDNT